MYSVNETIEAKFLLLHPTTGLPVTGATVVSTLYDETDTIHSYPTVTEIGNGLYTASFVPDTAGEWTIIFGCSTPVQSGGLTFPVGLGICKDVEDKVDIVDANVDSVLADTNELQTDWRNGGRLDLLLDGVKTKTDLIGASVAPASEYDTEMARITGNVALEATLTAIKGADWSTETLKAIKDAIDGMIANLVGSTTDSSFTLANSTDEQDAVVLTLTSRIKIFGVDLDVSNLTQPTTFRIYRKVDGTNYRLADTQTWSSSDPDVVFIQTPFAYDDDIKITIQSSVVEGTTRAIPYKIVKETMD